MRGLTLTKVPVPAAFETWLEEAVAVARVEVAARGKAVQSHGYPGVSSGVVVSAEPVGGFVVIRVRGVVPAGLRGLRPVRRRSCQWIVSCSCADRRSRGISRAVRRLSSQWVVLLLFECGASFLRDYAGSGLCGGVGASEL